MHARRLPSVNDPGFDSEHDLTFLICPVWLVIVFPNKVSFQPSQFSWTLFPQDCSFQDHCIHPILDMDNDSRIAFQILAFWRYWISFEIENVSLPDSPNRRCMGPSIFAGCRDPVDILSLKLSVRMLPSNPLLRSFRHMPFRRQSGSNASRHGQLSQSNLWWESRNFLLAQQTSPPALLLRW